MMGVKRKRRGKKKKSEVEREREGEQEPYGKQKILRQGKGRASEREYSRDNTCSLRKSVGTQVRERERDRQTGRPDPWRDLLPSSGLLRLFFSRS